MSSDLPLHSEPPRRRPTDPFETGVDDDFIFYLQQGGELLRGGKPEDARVALERARELKPDSARAQNLLGLAYFKLGLLEAARTIYERLVVDYPEEPPLAVNLGLVLLRQGRLKEAERVLSRAIELSPGHTRAHCYLGLVLYRRGDPLRAREHFLRGEAPGFADRVERKISQSQKRSSSPSEILQQVASAGVERLEGAPVFRSVAPGDELPLRDEEAWETKVGHQSETPEGTSAPAFPVPSLISAMAGGPSPEDQKPKVGEDAIELPQAPMPPVPDEAAFGVIRPSMAPVALMMQEGAAIEGEQGLRIMRPMLPIVEPAGQLFEDLDFAPGFASGPELGKSARLSLDGNAVLRARRVVAAAGELVLGLATRKDARGQSDAPFGGVNDPFYRVSGRARILLEVDGFAVAVREARDLLVREEVLVGIEGGLSFENGRLFGVDTVRLDGAGTLLIASSGTPVVVSVTTTQPLWVRVESLLALSTSLEVGLLRLGDPQTGPRMFQLRGLGVVILSGPALPPGQTLALHDSAGTAVAGAGSPSAGG